MVKLQLRLDQQQTDDILAALSAAIHLGEAGPQLERYKTMRSWLSWRRVKLWGEFGADRPARDGLPDEFHAGVRRGMKP